jgi:hypothetical protein
MPMAQEHLCSVNVLNEPGGRTNPLRIRLVWTEHERVKGTHGAACKHRQTDDVNPINAGTGKGDDGAAVSAQCLFF